MKTITRDTNPHEPIDFISLFGSENLFPVNYGQKTPLMNGWKDTLHTSAELNEYRNSGCNLGYKIPPSILVIDVDPKNGGDKSFKSLSHAIQILPITTHTPSGGFHIYTMLPDTVDYKNLATTLKDLPGIDFLHHGRYTVIPGSKLLVSNNESAFKEVFYTIGDKAKFPFPLTPQCLLDYLQKNSINRTQVAGVNGIEFTYEELRECLTLLDVMDYRNHGDWEKMMMASHNATSGGGIEEFLEWSLSDHLYGDHEDIIRKRWDSLSNDKPRLVTARHFSNELRKIGKEPEWLKAKIDESLFSPHGIHQTPTDVSNAEQMVNYFGDKIRYVPELQKWLCWNGRMWEDGDNEMVNLAKATVRTLQEKAINNIKDIDRRKKVMAKLIAAESVSKIEAMIKLAKADSRVRLSQEELDRDLFFINTSNGTLNLETGIIRPHDPLDLITRTTMIPFGEHNSCPKWIKFLNEIFDGHNQLIDYIHRAIGYSLSGDTSEQCFFFLYGNGANGKSTLLNILKKIMGSYAVQTSPETFMVNQYGGSGPTPELAKLRGTRVVVTNEVEDGKQLAENLIKQVTGQDTLSVRKLYCEPFEYIPQFKLWIAANNKPIIRGHDHGIWRRIHLIPFSVTITDDKQDKHLYEKLISELPDILAWAWAGYHKWKKKGLNPPKEVSDATTEYRTDMDHLKQWIDDCCVFAANNKEASADLYSSYSSWCLSNVQQPVTQVKFGRILSQKGYKKERSSGGRYWSGLAIKKAISS